MKLVASLAVRNEISRYLERCVTSLLGFCDEVVVLDDASDDGTSEWLADVEDERVHVDRLLRPGFFEHEGRLRQYLLDLTLARKPTHVLPIDADELVSDGATLLSQVEAEPDVPVWTLPLEEVWRAGPDRMFVREDGGWGRGVGFVWRVPEALDATWRIMNRKLSCRRVPPAVFNQRGRRLDGVEILHFGWADESNRVARTERYVQHDGGRFHARAHLASILWPDDRVTLRERPWPQGTVFDGLRKKLMMRDAFRAELLEMANRPHGESA